VPGRSRLNLKPRIGVDGSPGPNLVLAISRWFVAIRVSQCGGMIRYGRGQSLRLPRYETPQSPHAGSMRDARPHA